MIQNDTMALSPCGWHHLPTTRTLIMPSSPRARLEDVAREAGVSRVTVSRAFSNPDSVHPETLVRVHEVAERIGYRPHRRTRIRPSPQIPARHQRIGVVMPNLNNPFFGHIGQSLSKVGLDHEVDILVLDSYESEAQEQVAVERLLALGIDALIIAVISSDADYHPGWASRLEQSGIPVILLDREIDIAHAGGVYIDNTDCGYQAGAWMVSHNAGNVLVISGPGDSRVSIGRTSGIREALGATPIRVHYADFTMEPAYHFMKDVLSQGDTPEGVIAVNNQIALGIIKACLEAGVVPGRNLLLFSIDEVPYAEVFGYHFSCMKMNTEEVATRAMALALQAINKSSPDGGRIIVKATLDEKTA